MTKDSRILTEEELRSIAENHRKLSVALPAPSVNQSLVWSALHDIPKLLAHGEALQAENERYKKALEEIIEDISHYEPFDLNLLELEINRIAREALGLGEE
jgi:hypothetical protein